MTTHSTRISTLADAVMEGKAWGTVRLPTGYGDTRGATLEEAEEALSIVIERLNTDRDALVEALREYGAHQSWRCDHPDRYPQDENCSCLLVGTFRELGLDPATASPCRNA